MVVIVLTACPEGLRGHLTRWLMEISAGVFVGQVTARVQSLLWARVKELSKDGRALMVYHRGGEQGLAFEVHGHHWHPTDYDGVLLMCRPAEPGAAQVEGRVGWSKAGQRKRFARRQATDRSADPAPEVNGNRPEPG